MESNRLPPTKRQRTALSERNLMPSPPPPPPQDDVPAAPIGTLPGPPDSPPPPPPPEATLDQAQNNDIVPPRPPSVPPPPPPEQADHDDDTDIQDAAYWTRLAESSSSAIPASSSKIPLPSSSTNGTLSSKKNNKSALYLDTINRSVLDFDFEKLCSISLSNINVYACLVCGRYFQGRGRSSYAYLHSIDNSHHVFMNLSTAQTYILPDNYAVPEENQAALQDIKYLLNPTFTPKVIEAIDAGPAYDLNGEPYYPGFVGLNNVGRTDYVNAVVQALVHVGAIRDFFLQEREGEVKSELVKRFGALMRKMWNPKAFKAQVSPHEFLQQVATVSGNRFRITDQADPVEFLGWLLNRIHADLVGKRKRGGGESVISRCFQGVVQVESQALAARAEESADTAAGVAAEAQSLIEQQRVGEGQTDEQGRVCFDPSLGIDKRESPFFLLTMDLPPPPPVLGGEEGENLVPQVTIGQVLSKYDGQSLHQSPTRLTRYQLKRLPPYLIVHFRRFTKNSLGQEERNPTLVNFPIKGLDVTKHVPLLEQASVSEVYDLVANVVYDGVPGTVRQGASWKCQVHAKPTAGAKEGEKWFAIQDLLVEQVNRQMIFLGESYLQIWEKRSR